MNFAVKTFFIRFAFIWLGRLCGKWKKETGKWKVPEMEERVKRV